jgi:metal-dependent HD superfamily phosphatase/phosphodiesterase
MITYEEIKDNPKVKIYINKTDQFLEGIGYTEHGGRHAKRTADLSAKILTALEYSPRDIELMAIAGYLHDIGNLTGRQNHGQASALIAQNILYELGMPPEEVVLIMCAIGNHEEADGEPTDPFTAALILADKADVHKSRVRSPDFIKFDIHDRVNYAANRSFLSVDKQNKKIVLEVNIDTSISQVMEYFEIFLSRMIICRRAAKVLKCEFELYINDVKLL